MRDPEQIERAMHRLADQRISEAIESGEFANLAGAGRPLRDLDEAYDELWWVRKWLRDRQEDLDMKPGEARFRRVAAAEMLSSEVRDSK